MQGWVEAMTSLGRLIFLDQPGTGASDPVMPGALPTLEQWTDSITAVLDDLGAGEAVLLATPPHSRQGRSSPRHIRRVPPRCWSLEAAPEVTVLTPSIPSTSVRHGREVGHGRTDAHHESGHAVERRDPGIVGPSRTPRSEPPGIFTHHARPRRRRRGGVASDNPCAHARRPPLRQPVFPTDLVKYVADHIPGAKYVEVPGRNLLHFIEPWRGRSSRSPNSSPASSRKWPMIGFSRRCCSPTSWTRRAARRRWATVIGVHCSTRTTPWCG